MIIFISHNQETEIKKNTQIQAQKVHSDIRKYFFSNEEPKASNCFGKISENKLTAVRNILLKEPLFWMAKNWQKFGICGKPFDEICTF